MKIKVTNFQQLVLINAKPAEVYEHFMNEKKHTAFTGAKATIQRKIGGEFTAYDGYTYGKNLELVPGKKIVQTWKSKDDKWPRNHTSEISIEFFPIGSGKTKIVFNHRNVPKSLAEYFKQGWNDYYWTPLKKLFDNRNGL